MDHLIKQIVDMDRKAREITESAQKLRESSEQEISARRNQMRDDYLKQARKRIAVNEKEERAAAEAAWKRKNEKNIRLAQSLEELYRKKGGEWVDAIVARVTGA